MKSFFSFGIILCCGCLLAGDVPEFTLEQCIAYALEHSPALAKQKITVRNQKLQTVIEDAAFGFHLSAEDSHSAKAGVNSGNVTLSKDFESGFSLKSWVNSERENGRGVTASSAAVQISKSILGGGSTLDTQYNLLASMQDELAALNNFNRAKRKLVQDVKVSYYSIIQAQQSLQVKMRALENARHTLALTRERERPLDILTAEVRIPENELSVNSAQRTISNGLDSLKELMGMDMATPFNITGDFEFAEQPLSLENDIAFARENLETFLNNRLERKKLQWQAAITGDKNMPSVNISATHHKYGDGDGFNFEGREEQVVSLNLSWNLGLRAERARHAMAGNRLEANQHDYFMLDQELVNSLTSNHRRLLESAAAVTLQEKLCDFQKRKEELYRDKWENGEIDILELVRTQTDLENSYVELIGKKISYLQLLANYEFTVGR